MGIIIITVTFKKYPMQENQSSRGDYLQIMGIIIITVTFKKYPNSSTD